MTKNPESYGEPWSARITAAPPPVESAEVPVVSEDRLPWVVWANVCPAMACEDTPVFGSPGEVVQVDASWPIITFRRTNTVQLPGLTQEALAKRVAACVNFCAGIPDLESVGYPTLKALIASFEDDSIKARRDINKLWPLSKKASKKKAKTPNSRAITSSTSKTRSRRSTPTSGGSS